MAKKTATDIYQEALADPVTALNDLAAARARLAGYQNARDAEAEKLLAPYKKKLEKIEEKSRASIVIVQEKIQLLEKAIRETVAKTKEKVLGTEAPDGCKKLQCVPVKDKECWDTKMLAGIALDPEREWILGARSIEPSTPQIRILED